MPTPRCSWPKPCATRCSKGLAFSTPGRYRLAACLGLIAGISLADTSHAAATLPLCIGPHTFQVEVADTPAARTRGLMQRSQLAEASGMVFVFEAPARHCFWMRDTPLPLSVAFITPDGRIASLADMSPLTDSLHCADQAVRYALEVPQGAFHTRAITAGMRVRGLPGSASGCDR